MAHPHIPAAKPNSRRRYPGNFPGAAGFVISDTSNLCIFQSAPFPKQVGFEPTTYGLQPLLYH